VNDEVFPSLETARLVMREVTASDAPALLAIHADAQAMRWFGVDPPTDLGQAEQIVASFASLRRPPATGVRWALARKEGGALVGTCGLFRWNRLWGTCTTGYELARPAWGQGLMREALQAALGYGFARMSLERVEAQVHPDNAPSLKLLQGLGFVVEGRARAQGRWGGRRHDMLLLGLLESEYRKE